MVRRLIAFIAKGVVRHRRQWTFGVLLVSFIALGLGSQLTLRLDAEDFLPATSRSADPIDEAILSRFAAGGRVVVFLESEEKLEIREVGQLFEHLADRIQHVEGVQAVQYRVSRQLRRFLDQHGPDRFLLYVDPQDLRRASTRLSREGIAHSLLAAEDTQAIDLSALAMTAQPDPLGLLSLASRTIGRATGTSRVRLADGYFSLPGGRKFFFTVQPGPGMADIEKARVLVRGLEQVLRDSRSDEAVAELLEGKRLFAVGRPVSYVYAFDTMYDDVRRVALAATIAVLIVLSLFFRRPLAPLVLLLPVASGFALAAGMGFLIFGSVSLLAWIFVGALVGLGVDFGLHITTHYWVYGNPRAERGEAIQSALLRPGRGIFFGGLTSTAAFFSLQIVSYPVMKQIAWLTSLGLLAILVSSFTVLPLVLSHFQSESRLETRWHKWGTFFDRAGRTKPLLGSALWLLLIIVSVFAARSIQFETHPWKLVLRGNPKSAELERLNRELGSAFTPLLMVSRGRTQDEAIARDREATRALQRVAMRAGITSIESLSRWLPSPEIQAENIEFIQQNRDLFSPARFRRDFEEVISGMDNPDPYLSEEYLPLISRYLQPDQHELTLDDLRGLGLESEIERHLFAHQGEHTAISYIYLRKFPWAEGSVSRFLEVLDRAGVNELANVHILGEALRSASHSQILRRDVLLATLLAFALVAGILWIQFRNVLHAGLCLLPLICGVSAALLVMAILGIELNMLTLSIAPLLVGIGVDDGIHIVERLKNGEESETVLREAGSSMTMTTLTTVAAFACLGFATFEGIRDLGLVGSVGLSVCLLASLHLIPMWYRFSVR